MTDLVVPEMWSGRITVIEGDCWPWHGSLTPDGYGFGWLNGKNVRVHRTIYEMNRGPIGPGMVLDHVCHARDTCGEGVCEHRRCCNPDHLRVTTRGENSARANREKQTCPYGHPYDYVTARGWRQCKRCKNAQRQANR